MIKIIKQYFLSMNILLNTIYLIALFLILGLSADLAVKNIKYLAVSLKMKVFVLGAILGVTTTLPELSVGINASLRGISEISVGNILGGITVLIGLILGVSLILNKNVSTEDSFKSLVPTSLLILLPFLLGSDGVFSFIDGLIMILSYLALIIYLYKNEKRISIIPENFIIIEKKKIVKSIFYSLIGVLLVLISSSLIVNISSALLKKTGLNDLIMGIVVFSIGTNLPEIMIALTSWKRKATELSLSFLISSAFTSILALGIISVFKPMIFHLNLAYYILVFFLSLIMILFVIFSYTDKKLSRKEGIFLLLAYLSFLAANIIIAKGGY